MNEPDLIATSQDFYPKEDSHTPVVFSEGEAVLQLESGYVASQALLEDEDKLERFLQRLEQKLRGVPLAGSKLACLPVMVSLVRNYIKKEYQDIPIGSIIAIVSALIYFVSPIDIVPDSIPVLGYFDDAAVVAACWGLVESDVNEYISWREKTGRNIEI